MTRRRSVPRSGGFTTAALAAVLVLGLATITHAQINVWPGQTYLVEDGDVIVETITVYGNTSPPPDPGVLLITGGVIEGTVIIEP